MITNKNIDAGNGFDWGRTSADYAKYRDIYPNEFYQNILDLGLCTNGQKVLDIGTGTGVLPRNMYQFGADFIGTDIAENQIMQAQQLASQNGMDIEFLVCPTEALNYSNGSFDVITACQCFFYFDHPIVMPNLARMLKENGRLAVLYMAWLPLEDQIAGSSEELILRYNPVWSGANETRHPIHIPDIYQEQFEVEDTIVYDVTVPFTRESWNGRIKACRGIGASLSDSKIEEFEKEHTDMLNRIAPEKFDVLHYVAMKILRVIK